LFLLETRLNVGTSVVWMTAAMNTVGAIQKTRDMLVFTSDKSRRKRRWKELGVCVCVWFSVVIQKITYTKKYFFLGKITDINISSSYPGLHIK